MAHSTNKGLAIGGPDDGKVFTYQGTVLNRLLRSDELVAVDYSKTAQAPDEAEVFTYYYTSLQMLGRDAWRPNKEINYGFWVGRDMTIEDAMQAVLNRYQEPRREKSLLERSFRTIRQLWHLAAGQTEPKLNMETRDLMEALDREVHQ